MIGKPGPFQIIRSEESGCLEKAVSAPKRRYFCPHYACCLDLAASLNWDNFTCRGCNSEIDQSLLWRAHQAQKKDRIAMKICDLPNIKAHEVEDDFQQTKPGLMLVKG